MSEDKNNKTLQGVDELDLGTAARKIGDKFKDFTGIEKLEGFSLHELFSETFKKHSVDEVEDYFTVGTPRTIPDIKDVDTSWPRPWMFLRALAGTAAVYAILVVTWDMFENVNLIPGLIMFGAMAIPMATVLFFFEVNVRRNVSLYQVLRMLFFGGVISLLFSLVGFELSTERLGWLGAPLAGLIEEPGKLLALLVAAKSVKFRYKLNGLLFGAAVGAGFAAFESMGYAFMCLNAGGIEAMSNNILLRGFLSPFGHIVWTAICGAAIWRVKGDRPFRFSMLGHPKFWRLAIVPVMLHMIWNTDWQLPFFGKYLIIGFVAWAVVIALVQEGLKELRAEKIAALEPEKNIDKECAVEKTGD